MRILDACCGSKMFWFNREHKDVVYADKRQLSTILCDGRSLTIKPDVQSDFKNLPFSNESFYLVVMDPPHLTKAGDNSWLSKKYGKLEPNWQQDIKAGFEECWRVLKTNGTLIFKWNEDQIKLGQLLKHLPQQPLFGNQRSKTHWLVFMK